jgi:hypothetical protein
MMIELAWIAGALLGTIGAIGFGGYCLRAAAAGRNRWLTTGAMLLANISVFPSVIGWWHLTGRGTSQRSGELFVIVLLFGALCSEWSKTVMRWHLRPVVAADELRGHIGGWSGALVVFPSLFAIEVMVAPPHSFFLAVFTAALFAVAACAFIWYGFNLLLPLPATGSADEAATRSRNHQKAAAIYAGGIIILTPSILLVRHLMQVYGWSVESVAALVVPIFVMGFLVLLSSWADMICFLPIKKRTAAPATKTP